MSSQKTNYKRNEIIRTARAVVSELELDKALSILLKKAMRITNTSAGTIALYTAETATMRIHAYRGFSKKFISNPEWIVRTGGLTDRILKSKSIKVINEHTHPDFFTYPAISHEGIKSLICVPLMVSQEVVGVLYLDDTAPRKFRATDLQILKTLASFASIAIRHARTHYDIKQQAITDGLTGLFNRRYFENLLARELQRAERHGHELSLALVDVDNFKMYNDKFGHQAGDAALTALGAAIRHAVRSTDLAARYGGDEIVIILPETKLSKAYNLFSDRIRYEIEEGFATLSENNIRLTVTIGIASFPQDGLAARELVLAADTALLAAKKDKQNRKIGCSRMVGTAVVTPSRLHTVPDAGLGLP